MTCAKGSADEEHGADKDGEKLPHISLGCYVSEHTGLPVFYRTTPGSIADKSHLPCTMVYNDDLGIKNICFILNREFCSTANVGYMAKNNLKFIIGVEQYLLTTRNQNRIERTIEKIIYYRNITQSKIFGDVLYVNFYNIKASIHIFCDQMFYNK